MASMRRFVKVKGEPEVNHSVDMFSRHNMVASLKKLRALCDFTARLQSPRPGFSCWRRRFY